MFYSVAHFWATSWTFREFHHSVDQLPRCCQEHHSWIFYWTSLHSWPSPAVFRKAWGGNQVPEWTYPRNSEPNLPRLCLKPGDKSLYEQMQIWPDFFKQFLLLQTSCVTLEKKQKTKYKTKKIHNICRPYNSTKVALECTLAVTRGCEWAF